MKIHFKNYSKLLFLVTILTSIMYITSCSKDSTSEIKYGEENFLNDYLKNAGFDQKVSTESLLYITEYFIDFTPSVNGQINSLVIKAPTNQNQVMVTIVDKTLKKQLKTVDISCLAGRDLVQTIDPIVIKKENTYRMIVTYSSVYNHKKTDDTPTTYPIKAGNINILRFGTRYISSSVESQDEITKYYSGDFSFNFQRTE
jgi:hypothetical protein